MIGAFKGMVAAIAMLLMTGTLLAAQTMEILSTSGCGCCVAWERYLKKNGYVTSLRNLPMADLWQRKVKAGLKLGLTSCHTGFIEGYVVEGHVPVREIRRLLFERPDAIGIVVPDMPYGSPGMGEAGPDADPYKVLLVRKDGTTEVYASYP
ncbi:MAG: DUF411 domain-containing protein [Pseudolabrys sp.]|nr:DUF411 domain-containing protein [Pseudolabrys sp.]